jgi:FMN phosphatase YigB (HAD superfamily)
MSDLKLIMFDVFGTVVDMSAVDRDEIRAYIEHIRKPEWSPLELPASWRDLPLHPDSKAGIARLAKNYKVVTCSNGNFQVLQGIVCNHELAMEVCPLELFQVFKPNAFAYLAVCAAYRAAPEQAMMVTANKTFGDLEASERLGIRPKLIRDETGLTIEDLAAELGC